jgi:hypothetical protein
VLLNAYFYRSACFADVTSVTITWDAVRTLLRLLGIFNPSSVRQCPTECMSSFENGPNIEMVYNAPCPSILYMMKDGCFSMASLCSQQILTGFH